MLRKTRLLNSLIILITLALPLFSTAQEVQTGIDVLQKEGFSSLKGKRVGLITNPTGIDSKFNSTVDILNKAPQVNLVALFSPEHGIRGNYSAGENVESSIDKKTGLKVYSIYGKNRKPSPRMLEGLDAIVYDIQDIGVRSYTYISTMGLAMEACAENDIEFIVLDRPNPLGGYKTEGSLVESKFTSFVSQFPIPYIYGLTCGELAHLLNKEGYLKDQVRCNLKVIKMEGWKREMLFSETGLPWVPTSPHIPNAYSAIYYSTSGILGELYVMSIGVGYTQPFELFAAPWIDAEELSHNLNNLKLPGVHFRPVHYKPYYSVGKGIEHHGVQLHIRDINTAPLSLIQFYVLQECHKLYPEHNPFEMCEKSRLTMFDKVCGSNRIRDIFTRKFLTKEILPIWNKDTKSFIKLAKRYYLY